MTWRHGERPQYAEDGSFGQFLRTLRHPLRLLAMGLAALAVSSGVLMSVGVGSAVAGAMLGVIAGEIAGRSRLKLAAIATSILLLLLASWGLASASTDGEWIPSLVGPGAALKLSGALRWGSLAFALTALLRSVAVRRPAALALEMGAVITAVAVQFASHRDGVIARPLWISDWAWQKGIDPGDVFLFVGAAAAVVLAVLMVLETRSGRSVSSLLALPALALLAVACLDVVGTPTPQAEDGLGLTEDDPGDPPQQMPEVDDPGGGGAGETDDGGGASPESGGDGGLPGGGGEADGGVPGAQRDGGVGQGGTADGGSAQGGMADGGAQGGESDAGGTSGGDADAGAGGGGRTDAGDSSGGGADAGGRDAGAGGGGRDASLPTDVPPPSEGATQEGDAPPRPPTEQQFTDDADQAPSNSPAPMAVVVLENDYSPPAGGYYFRQAAWSRFNGTRLVPAEMDGVDDDTLADFPTRPTPVNGPPEQQRARVRARVALLVGHQHPFALETPVMFEPMTNPNPERFQRAYRFESLAQQTDYRELLGRRAGDPEWTDEEHALYLEGHADPRFAELAQEILDENLPEAMHSDPFARALSIKLWLDQNLIYSTQHRHANAEDPTVDFLFGNRTGYCVHFAHSAVLLWRAAGVPARVGTGYMVPEENRRGGSSILVRSGDAHAWPELYVEDMGWVVLDISAAENLDEPGQPLDEDLQRMLGEMARDQPADPEDEITDDEESSILPHIDPWIAAGVLLGVILLVLYTIKLWRRLSPVFAPGTALPRVGYRALLDRLAEVGLAREYGETREQFAARVGELAPAFAQATSLHVAARLRDPSVDPASREELERSRWRSISREVRKQLRGGTRWWRRLVGTLHPVSFLDAR